MEIEIEAESIYIYVNNSMCYWFLVWLQVIFNEIYQRVTELEICINNQLRCLYQVKRLPYHGDKVITNKDET